LKLIKNKNIYAEAARKAADFVLEKLRNNQGKLIKRYRQGEAALPAHLDDYVFMIWGLLELYEASFEVFYLQKAIELNEIMLSSFWDNVNGGLFFSADSTDNLIVRSKEIYDGAIPSGNSVAALNLLRIGRITANPELEKKALAIARVFSEQIHHAPSGFTQMMSTICFALGPSCEIVIAGHRDKEDTRAMLTVLRRNFLPNKVILFRPDDSPRPSIVNIAPYTEFQRSVGGKATAYVCTNFACKSPTSDIATALNQIKEIFQK